MKPLQERTRTVALSVAGIDPCGGAGVYSDIRTFAHFGLKGMAVPTCLTVQNDSEFKKLEDVNEQLFTEMLNYMFDSYKVAALKIGLITEPYHIDAVVDCIRGSNPPLRYLIPLSVLPAALIFGTKNCFYMRQKSFSRRWTSLHLT